MIRPAEVDQSTWTILVTDNEPDVPKIIQFTCEHFGVRCLTASSGTACLDEVKRSNPNIILLDIQMPIMSGWEVLKNLQAHAERTKMLIVAVTAHAMAGDRERILAAGFDGYLRKPIRPVELLEHIRSLLQDRVHR